jgi:hypothetical protein
MSVFGTIRKWRPTRRKAAHGSKADSGKPSANVFMSSRPKMDGPGLTGPFCFISRMADKVPGTRGTQSGTKCSDQSRGSPRSEQIKQLRGYWGEAWFSRRSRRFAAGYRPPQIGPSRSCERGSVPDFASMILLRVSQMLVRLLALASNAHQNRLPSQW